MRLHHILTMVLGLDLTLAALPPRSQQAERDVDRYGRGNLAAGIAYGTVIGGIATWGVLRQKIRNSSPPRENAQTLAEKSPGQGLDSLSDHDVDVIYNALTRLGKKEYNGLYLCASDRLLDDIDNLPKPLEMSLQRYYQLVKRFFVRNWIDCEDELRARAEQLEKDEEENLKGEKNGREGESDGRLGDWAEFSVVHPKQIGPMWNRFSKPVKDSVSTQGARLSHDLQDGSFLTGLGHALGHGIPRRPIQVIP